MQNATSKIVWVTIFISIIFSFQKNGYSSEKRQALERIRLANPSSQTMSFLPFELGIKKGFYRTEGIELEILLMKSALGIAAIRSGDIEFAGSAGDSIRAAAAGMPIKLVFVNVDRLPTILVSKPEIKDVKGLKGKVIGTGSVGTSQWLATREVLKHFGLDPDKDLTLISVGAGMLMPALLAGSVDAVVEAPPKSILAKRKGYRELARVADFVIVPSIGLATTERRIKERPTLVKKMVRATLKGMIFAKENKMDAMEHMVKEWGIDRDLVKETYEIGVSTYTKNGVVSDRGILTHIDLLRLTGARIEKDINISQIVDFSLLKDVHRELGLN